MIKQTEHDGYYVDTNGIVYSILSGILKPLKPWYDTKKRYLYVGIHGVKHSVHRIVAETFLDNAECKPEVNHINSKTDDNRLENLEWCTRKENMQHAYDNGYSPIRNFRNCIVYKNDIQILKCKSVNEACRFLHNNYDAPYHQLNKHRVWKEFSIVKCND